MSKSSDDDTGFGFAAMMVVVILLSYLLASGHMGKIIASLKHDSGHATAAATSANLVAYQHCNEAPSSSTKIITYTSGPAKPGSSLATSQLGLCTSNGTVSTDNDMLAPLKITSTDFTTLADQDLKNDVLSSDAVVSGNCAVNGVITDYAVVSMTYIKDKFAYIQPKLCDRRGGLDALLYVYVAGGWQLVDDPNTDGRSGGDFQCSILDQYKVPPLFVVAAYTAETKSAPRCETAGSHQKDLVSNFVFY